MQDGKRASMQIGFLDAYRPLQSVLHASTLLPSDRSHVSPRKRGGPHAQPGREGPPPVHGRMMPSRNLNLEGVMETQLEFDTDVLIVGTGPTGATAALALATHSFD